MSDVTSSAIITAPDAVPDEALMTPNQFSRELKYQVSLHFVKNMFDEGIISITDFDKWQALLLDKCDPPIGRIVSNKR